MADGSTRQHVWRSKSIKYPKGCRTRRDWAAEADFAKSWRPSRGRVVGDTSMDGPYVRSIEGNEGALSTREKRPRDCHQESILNDAPPEKRGGAREGGGRRKGSYGPKRMRELLHTCDALLQGGMIQCAKEAARGISAAAMLAASVAVEKSLAELSPPYLFKGTPAIKTTTEIMADGQEVVSYLVNVRTARSWLHKLGCEYRDAKSGLYFDGHDREDVLKYRVEIYLPAYSKHRDYADIWIGATRAEAVSWGVEFQEHVEGENGESGQVRVCVHSFKETLSELPETLRLRVTSKRLYPDGRKAIFCYQDECIYGANDGERKSWVPPNVHGLKQKGDGAGIMISGTIVDNVGFIEGDQDDINERCDLSAHQYVAGYTTNRPQEYPYIEMLFKDVDGKFWTYFEFEYGKNKEGYWTGERMGHHMADVLDLLTAKLQNYKPICFFDWSSRHDCVEEGAPNVSRINVGYGGVRKGADLAAQDAVTILEDTPKLKKGQVQHLTFQEGDIPLYDADASDHIGKVKGLKQILFERGLLVSGMTKLGTKGNPALSMVAVLSAQLDFVNVEPSLVILVRRCGGVALMLPKFHCELNPIELVRGRSKYWIRKHCKYTIQCLRQNVWQSFKVADDRLSLAIVQTFCRKVANYHEVYRQKLTGPEAVAKRQTFKSHRRPAPSEFITPT